MVIIEFKNGNDWYKANWVFRQICEDVTQAFPNDIEIKEIMMLGGEVSFLDFHSFKNDALLRTLKAIKKVLEDSLAEKNTDWKKAILKEDQAQYIQSLTELLPLINEELKYFK